MIPSSKELAIQIAMTHELYPKETISELAQRMMYSPVFIINALDEGEKMELFTRDKGKDELILSTPINYETLESSAIGTENERIQNEILRVLTSANHDQDDVESGTLGVWLTGIKPNETELALHILHKLKYISSYDLKDPKDKKSVYTFYTLRINEGKQWGKKQFRSFKKGKKEA